MDTVLCGVQRHCHSTVLPQLAAAASLHMYKSLKPQLCSFFLSNSVHPLPSEIFADL